VRVNNVVVGVVVAVTLALAGAGLVFAQSVPPPPPAVMPTPSAQSAVHVTTRIVQVSVTVHDDRGRPVTGLTKDDFILLDEGKRQQITSITEQNNRLVTMAAAAKPNLFTNRYEQGATAQPSLTVIVIDAYNAGFWDAFPRECGGKCPPLCAIGPIFSEVGKFISQMKLQDRVALYELADKLYLLQDFSADTDALNRALASGKQYVPTAFYPSQTAPRDMDAHTMDAMHAIADRLAKVPGRKNMIWLSTGFPPDAGLGKTALNAVEITDKTAKTLGDADFPLFSLNALGLMAGGGEAAHPSGGGGGGGKGPKSGGDFTTPAQRDGNYGGTAACPILPGRIPQVGDFDYTKDLSDMSGGRAYENTNDLAGSIRKVIDDSAQTYILSYYPDHNKWNGEFREIKVKVDRPGLSGLEVRARKGYYAIADTTTVQQRDAQKLIDAIRSPLETTDLGFDVQADGVEVAEVRQLKVKISVDTNQLRFSQENGRSSDSLSETWAEFNAEGKQVGEISKTIDLSRTESEYTQLLKDGFTFSKTLVLAKDAIEVRLILRDEGNGTIGSVIIPLSRVFAAVAETQTKK
jgi:VWFA-related protein